MAVNAETTSKLLLTTREAAAILSISPRTLWTLTQSWIIPAIRVGVRSVRYRLSDLKTWVDSQQHSGIR